MRPVEEIYFSGIFFVSSIILTLSIVWSIYDEVITRREWKIHQSEFIALEFKKTSAEYKKAKDYLKSPEVKGQRERLENKLKEAKERLKSKGYKEAVFKKEATSIELNEVSRQYQFIKGKLAELDYQYYLAQHNSGNKADGIKEKIAEQKKILDAVDQRLAARQGEFDKAKERVRSYLDDINKLNSELSKITAQSDKLEERLKSIKNKEVKIEQIIAEPLKRIDRCNTCHTVILKEGYNEYPEPFRSHPGEYLKTHPVEKFGCTVCHHGQGLATILPDSHGRLKYWDEPMYKKENIQASCAKCHEAENPTGEEDWPPEIIEVSMPSMEVINKGRRLFKELGCIGCHAINGKGGNVSVDLGEIADKAVEELDFTYIEGEHSVANWIYEHFLNPQKVTKIRPLPGIIYDSSMPNNNLTKEDADALTTLMLSLTSEKKKISYYYYKDKVLISPPAPVKYASKVEKGKASFLKFGCVACHGKNGQGGIENPNYIKKTIPALNTLAEKMLLFEKEDVEKIVNYLEQGVQLETLAQEAPVPRFSAVLAQYKSVKDTIKKGIKAGKLDPNGAEPPLYMPTWGTRLSDEDIGGIIAYLLSIYPFEENKGE